MHSTNITFQDGLSIIKVLARRYARINLSFLRYDDLYQEGCIVWLKIMPEIGMLWTSIKNHFNNLIKMVRRRCNDYYALGEEDFMVPAEMWYNPERLAILHEKYSKLSPRQKEFLELAASMDVGGAATVTNLSRGWVRHGFRDVKEQLCKE